jgi:hypothetical protein
MKYILILIVLIVAAYGGYTLYKNITNPLTLL